jgi:hypothetical protein
VTIVVKAATGAEQGKNNFTPITSLLPRRRRCRSKVYIKEEEEEKRFVYRESSKNIKERR